MIYVDDALIKATVGKYRGRWSHLFAVPHDEDELIRFAKSIDLKPEWIQRGSYVHFDVISRKRLKAIALGAKPVTLREAVKLMSLSLTRIPGNIIEVPNDRP